MILNFSDCHPRPSPHLVEYTFIPAAGGSQPEAERSSRPSSSLADRSSIQSSLTSRDSVQAPVPVSKKSEVFDPTKGVETVRKPNHDPIGDFSLRAKMVKNQNKILKGGKLTRDSPSPAMTNYITRMIARMFGRENKSPENLLSQQQFATVMLGLNSNPLSNGARSQAQLPLDTTNMLTNQALLTSQVWPENFPWTSPLSMSPNPVPSNDRESEPIWPRVLKAILNSLY